MRCCRSLSCKWNKYSNKICLLYPVDWIQTNKSLIFNLFLLHWTTLRNLWLKATMSSLLYGTRLTNLRWICLPIEALRQRSVSSGTRSSTDQKEMNRCHIFLVPSSSPWGRNSFPWRPNKEILYQILPNPPKSMMVDSTKGLRWGLWGLVAMGTSIDSHRWAHSHISSNLIIQIFWHLLK